VDLFRIAPSNRRSFVGICRKFLSRPQIQGVDVLAVLLYVQRDACDTTKIERKKIQLE